MDVTVVIPTYNRATLIAAALDSVLSQSAVKAGRRAEIAVVDDGSTDATADVVKPYVERHGDGPVRMTYTRLQKQGVVTARNTAIAQTTAPLIAFLDSDDVWEPTKLEKQIALFDADPGVVVTHTAFRYIDEQGRFADTGTQRRVNPCVGDCVKTLLDEDLVIFSSAVARRSVIERIARDEPHGRPFDPRWTNAQDYDLLLRCALHGKYGYVAEPLTLYRLHGAHGAMGNLRKAFGFHCRVQMDFVKRHGAKAGVDDAEAARKAARFLWGRADSAFWKRDLTTCKQLCELAAELGVGDARFEALARKASRPAWLYAIKDRADALLGRSAKPGGAP